MYIFHVTSLSFVDIHVPSADFLPAYYQACLGASPLRSGVLILSLSASIGPSVVVSGVSIGVTKKYRVQLWLGWVLNVVGMGVLSILRPDSPLSHQVGLPILMAIGAGTIYAATYFPVLAPLPISENAHALALFAFLRSFASVGSCYILYVRAHLTAPSGLGRYYRNCGVAKRASQASP